MTHKVMRGVGRRTLQKYVITGRDGTGGGGLSFSGGFDVFPLFPIFHRYQPSSFVNVKTHNKSLSVHMTLFSHFPYCLELEKHTEM